MSDTLPSKHFILPVEFKKLRFDAMLPVYSSGFAAGADLRSVEFYDIPPGQWRLVRTGLAIALPEGTEAQVRPRSGLALRYGVTVLNAPGTIDSDYRGEIGALLINHGHGTFSITPGDRIAQLVIAHVTRAEFVEVKNLPSTERGEGGFGSTGV
jgi:dUTP pyrophosphatase